MDGSGVLRLKFVTQPDSSALVSVLQLLQSLRSVPLRVIAERVTNRDRTTEVFEIEIAVSAADLAPDAFRVFAAKINQIPTILTTITGE